MASADYYKTLGVEKNASKDDIKKAFHKLAHKHHPDKKGGDEKKFKEINEAYQVLSDDKKRAQYDTYGNAFGGGEGPQGSGGFSGADFSGMGFDFSDLFRRGGVQFEQGGGEFGDIFETFFGGGQGRKKVKRGRDISIDIQMSFSESIFGVEKKVLINKIGTCDTCGGSGAKQGSKNIKCKVCNGKGKIVENKRSFLGTFSTERTCDNCFGKGEVPEEKCRSCDGKGILKKNEEISMKIPAGINDGEMMKMAGRGEAVVGGTPGDLYIKVHVERHQTLKREGHNLFMDLEVKMTDAILGAEYKIKTLDGEISIKIPVGVSTGDVLKVSEKGVPVAGGRRGDLLVRVNIKTPMRLSKKAVELIEDLKREGL